VPRSEDALFQIGNKRPAADPKIRFFLLQQWNEWREAIQTAGLQVPAPQDCFENDEKGSVQGGQ
jgi:hypothetical protein